MKLNSNNQNFILIGAGIMSATLGVLIKKLMPNAQIKIFERLDRVGAESSDAWNNAGTGHSAFCELNYTPQLENGTVDISKALRISEQFEVSKQFWAHLKEMNHLNPKTAFINDIDHMSFVWGEKNAAFLKNRYSSLAQYAMFEDMIFSENEEEISEWVPLMMNNREDSEMITATRMAIGTDVNFGAITRGMIEYLDQLDGVEVHLGYEVQDIVKRKKKGGWKMKVEHLETKNFEVVRGDFVFIGAGGGALPLLDKTDIPESRGFGGFPVGGLWMKCKNPDVIKQHEAKVYGKAAVGSPPMSVPHLDTRMLDGERSLLFGPYAGFSTKFLKNGSYSDLFLSIEMHNVWPMLSAGLKNIPLTKYLIDQVMDSKEDKFSYLKQYFPDAQIEDWDVVKAGQRVQIIKKNQSGGGELKFGTEVVTDQEGTLAALLGASPGASTSVSIMIEVLRKSFPENFESGEWQSILKEIIPSFGDSLIDNGNLLKETRARTTAILKLDDEH